MALHVAKQYKQKKAELERTINQQQIKKLIDEWIISTHDITHERYLSLFDGCGCLLREEGLPISLRDASQSWCCMPSFLSSNSPRSTVSQQQGKKN